MDRNHLAAIAFLGLSLSLSGMRESTAGRSRDELLAERRRVAAGAEVVSYRRIEKVAWKQRNASGNLLPETELKDVDLRMWIVRPSKMPEGRLHPAILFFHGGGFWSGSPEQFLVQADIFAGHGMVAFCVEYRLKDRVEATIAEQLEDARAAIRWVREHASPLRIDPEKVVAAGDSAGGYLALASAVLPPIARAGPSAVPNAVVAYNPAVDFDRFAAENGIRHMEASLGGPMDRFSCTPNARPGLPPILIFQGEADKKTPLADVRSFADRTQQLGNACELVTFPGLEHGFHNRDPFIEDCARRALAFLKRQGFELP